MNDRKITTHMWHGMIATHNDMKRVVLTLLLHPDATPEQIEQVRQVYRASHAEMTKAYNAMVGQYGNNVPPFE